MKISKLFISAVFIFPMITRAGIPVMVDADPLRQAEWVKEAQRWVDTAKHYQSQLQAYKEQLATATGLRDIQGLVAQGKSLKNDITNLQKQGISLDDLLTSGNAPTGALDSLYNRFKDFDVC
ncbi:type IV secretion system protein VirB5, partial [Salmonella enterica subsp. enterica serovar Agama]|nr:type IV secretion system protein VirB5 [Salmonella enterica subsp. enterica serovar Agama]